MAKKSIAQTIYAQIAAKHPDWSQPRIYAATKAILNQNRQTKSVKNKNVQ